MELNKLNFDELKVVADKLEVSYRGNILEETLREKVATFIADNPGCLGDETPNEPEVEPEAPIEKTLDSDAKDQLTKMDDLDDVIAKATAERDAIDKSAEISMTSKFRGVIDTSVGSIDFGTEGKATVTARQAKFLKTMNGYNLC